MDALKVILRELLKFINKNYQNFENSHTFNQNLIY